MEEAFDVTKFPEGKEKIKESLDFLPPIDAVREDFVNMLIIKLLFAM